MASHGPEMAGGDPAPRIWLPPVRVPSRVEDKYHALLWQVRGITDVVIEDQPRRMTVGHAVWIPIGTSHEFTVHADSVLMPIFFDSADTATTLQQPTFVIVDRDLQTLVIAYSVAWSTDTQPLTNLTRQILSIIENCPALSTGLRLPRGGPARAVAETLRFNPGDVRSIDALAVAVDASPRTLERAFRAETGMTLRQWRIRNRMEAARRLLRSGAGVEPVAHRVGYRNVNAFRRVFKQYADLTPTEYAGRQATT